jgi:hypothetical protein
MSRNRLALLLVLAAATAYTATGEFLKGATADRVKGDRRLPYYPPQYPVEPPVKSKKSKKGGSKGYDPCYGKGKGKGSGTFSFRIAVGDANAKRNGFSKRHSLTISLFYCQARNAGKAPCPIRLERERVATCRIHQERVGTCRTRQEKEATLH